MGRRRGQGEGSIYFRQDRQCWVGAILLPDGRRRRFHADTKREVQEWLRKNLAEADKGALPAGPRQTVSQYLERWLADVAATSVKPRTLARYGELIRLHAIPMLGKTQLDKLTPQQLQALYSKKLKDGLAPRTCGHIHRVLHRAFNDATKWDLIARNPCDRVDPPRVGKVEMAALDEQSVRRLLDAAREDPLEALYVLAVTSGAREGELLALKWTDIDLATPSMQICRTVYYANGVGHVWSEPKSATSRRKIVLTTIAVDALERHRERQSQLRALARESWEEKGLVFTNRVGRALIAANFYYRSFKPLLVRAGLPNIRFHDLRHTTASLLLAQSTHPKVVQEILGHSSIGITMDTYSHLVPTLQAEAVDLLGQRLSKAAEPDASSGTPTDSETT